MNVLIDRLSQLRRLYHLLSRSEKANLPIDDSIVERIKNAREEYLDEYVELERVEEVDSVDYCEGGLDYKFPLERNSDLLNLIYHIGLKFGIESPANSCMIMIRDSKKIIIYLHEEKIVNLISPLIEYLQALDLRDDGLDLQIGRFEFERVIGVYTDTVNRIKNMNSFERAPIDMISSILEGTILPPNWRPFYSFSLGINFLVTTMTFYSDLMNANPKYDKFNIFERLMRLEYYYYLSSTLKRPTGRLDLESLSTGLVQPLRSMESTIDRVPNIKKTIAYKGLYAFTPKIDDRVRDFRRVQIKDIDTKDLRDIQYLTFIILSNAISHSIGYFLIDNVLFKKNMNFALQLTDPLIDYYERQDYSSIGDEYPVMRSKHEYRVNFNCISEFSRLRRKFDGVKLKRIEEYLASLPSTWRDIIRNGKFESRADDLHQLYEYGLKLEKAFDSLERVVTVAQKAYIKKRYSPDGEYAEKLANESMMVLDNFLSS